MTRKFLTVLVAGTMLSGNAWAGCVRPEDQLTMKTSSMQQELMVAALSCGDIALYNRFVVFYQSKLQETDAALMNFFVRSNGESGEGNYHAFKTRAANVASLESARNRDGYCANAERLFAVSMNTYGADLAGFVGGEWHANRDYIPDACEETQTAMIPRQ